MASPTPEVRLLSFSGWPAGLEHLPPNERLARWQAVHRHLLATDPTHRRQRWAYKLAVGFVGVTMMLPPLLFPARLGLSQWQGIAVAAPCSLFTGLLAERHARTNKARVSAYLRQHPHA